MSDEERYKLIFNILDDEQYKSLDEIKTLMNFGNPKPLSDEEFNLLVHDLLTEGFIKGKINDGKLEIIKSHRFNSFFD